MSPRNTREWAMREIEAARNNIEWANSHLSGVIKIYDEAHKEISEPLIKTISVLTQLRKLLAVTRGSF